MRDSWNATLYDDHHQFVSYYGKGMVELLALQQGERILDVGCGTGDLAASLTEQGAHVVGIDLSQNMVDAAAHKYPHIDFAQRDVTNLSFSNEFDAVFSNATLHWVKTPEAAIHSIYTALKKGGRFVAEFGGIGNVETITSTLIDEIKRAGIAYRADDFPWYFPSIAEYCTLLEQAGFHVTFAEHFDRPTKLDGEDGLRNWLDMFSHRFFEHVPTATKETVYVTTIARLRPLLMQRDAWYADYKRLRIVAYK